MKRIVFAFTLLLTLLLLTACDNGSVSESSVSKTSDLVKVSLAVDDGSSEMQKSISINEVNYTYFYKAVPQWSQDRPIAGSTNDQFVQIPGYDSGEQSLGYFSSGEWIFYAQVRIGDTPVYEGDSGIISINSSQNIITVPVAKIIGDRRGGVSINIKAPTMDNTDKLTITWGDGQGVSESTTVPGSANGSITTFTHEVDNLVPGTYTFTFSHNNATGRGGAIAVDLHQNEMVVITGQLDNGEWLLRSINLAVYSIRVNNNQYGEVWAPITAAVPGDRVDFSLNPNDGASVLSCSIVSDEEQIQPIDTNNFQYSFIMPVGNVTINAVFGVPDDIEVEEFQTLFLYFYIRNYNSVVSFGRAANGPGAGIEYKQKNKIKVWYDSTNNKICWHSDVDDNILKFRQGSLSGLFMSTTFTSIDLTGFDTSNIDNMSHLFDSCEKLQTVNLAGINTRAVTDMSYMFYKAGYSYIPMQHKIGGEGEDKTLLAKIPNTDGQYLSITGLNGENFKTDLVENMEYMFSLCSAQNLDVSRFNASKVTNFSHMFAGKSENGWKDYWPTKFDSLDVSNWNVGGDVGNNTIDLSNMFDISYKLTSLSLTSWKFSKVTTMYEMFNRCESMTHIIFPEWTDLENVTTLKGVFNHTAEMLASGDGSFEHIFQRWDIRKNDYTQGLGGMIDFKATPHDAVADNSANHIFQSDTASMKDAALEVYSYGDLNNPGPLVKVGGWGDTNDYRKMRLIKNP